MTEQHAPFDQDPTRSYPAVTGEADAAEHDAIAHTGRAMKAVLHETRRVVIGQDAMLERVLVALLAGGHVLLEGVPGLAKTLTVKTLAQVMGGTFRGCSSRLIWCRPISWARASGAPIPAASTPNLAPSSATCCWPTRSTARPPRCSRRCLR